MASATSNIQNGNWHNLAVVVGSGTSTFYLDGNLIGNR